MYDYKIHSFQFPNKNELEIIVTQLIQLKDNLQKINEFLRTISPQNAWEITRINWVYGKMNYQFSQWINHRDEKIDNVAIIVHVLELAASVMSYEDTMEFYFNLNFEYLSGLDSLVVMLLLKRAKSDNEFNKKMTSDNALLPILLNRTLDKNAVALMRPELIKPITAEAKKHLASSFASFLGFNKDALTAHEQDIVSIHALLTDKDLMLKQLERTEADLNKKIKDTNKDAKLPLSPLLESNYTHFKKPYPKEKGESFLFEFFRKWVKNNGFNELIRLTGNTTTIAFVDNLKNGLLFSDKFFTGAGHGSWTHLIQWCCIVNAYNFKELILSEPPSQVLKTIGRMQNPSEKDGDSVWYKTFEDQPFFNIYIRDNFRGVFWLNKFFVNNGEFAQRCPTLQAMISYRIFDQVRKKQKSEAVSSSDQADNSNDKEMNVRKKIKTK